MDQRKVIVFLALAAALVAVVVVWWMWFTPTSTFPLDTSVPIAPVASEEPAPSAAPFDTTLTPQATSGGAFNLDVLQRTGYKSLDLRPIQDGLLPIKPPATTGKANPFL